MKKHVMFFKTNSCVDCVRLDT